MVIPMRAAKIAISLDSRLLQKLDSLVRKRLFPSRSKAIQSAVEEKLFKVEKGRLARECAKLNPKSEKRMAEDGLRKDAAAWPEY
jgi:Arc/MetJ-type ribon-helix-helix transcriptional regulator